MPVRKQEKVGWIGGWLGGFIWVLILSIVFFVQGKALHAWVGVVITCVASASIVFLSPWRFPKTQYRTLMMPIYVLFFLAIAWGVWSMGDPRQMGINSWWSALVLMPILIPLWTAGNRRWDEGEG
jgi:phosphatidylserine synthase